MNARSWFVVVLLGAWGQILAQPALPPSPPPPAGGTAAKPVAQPDEPIDFERARALMQKRRNGQELTQQEQAYLERAIEARRGGAGPGPAQPAAMMRDTSALKPLTEMSAEDRYKGEDGGLYGQGRNTPPQEHVKAAKAALAAIQPLDDQGRPAPDGKVVFVSPSMSNATQEFSTFKRLADADVAKSARLLIVDCAQGGQAMAEWAPPNAPPWKEAQRRLTAAGADDRQVQVAWVKLANKGPRGDLQEHGRKLRQDTLALLQNAKQRFPNLRIAYLSSRIYAGYATTQLNPEPYAYESAFSVRGLIESQIANDPNLNYDPAKGAVKAPLLLWGPYLWADGIKPRQGDGLVWTRGDLGADGTHPSPAGRQKVADMLLTFFKNDASTKLWFAKPKP